MSSFYTALDNQFASNPLWFTQAVIRKCRYSARAEINEETLKKMEAQLAFFPLDTKAYVSGLIRELSQKEGKQIDSLISQIGNARFNLESLMQKTVSTKEALLLNHLVALEACAMGIRYRETYLDAQKLVALQGDRLTYCRPYWPHSKEDLAEARKPEKNEARKNLLAGVKQACDCYKRIFEREMTKSERFKEQGLRLLSKINEWTTRVEVCNSENKLDKIKDATSKIDEIALWLDGEEDLKVMDYLESIDPWNKDNPEILLFSTDLTKVYKLLIIKGMKMQIEKLKACMDGIGS